MVGPGPVQDDYGPTFSNHIIVDGYVLDDVLHGCGDGTRGFRDFPLHIRGIVPTRRNNVESNP